MASRYPADTEHERFCSVHMTFHPKTEFYFDSTAGNLYRRCKDIATQASSASRRKRLLEAPERRRSQKAWRVKRNYGITIEQYDFLFEQQGGLCALASCSEPLGAIDHDHAHADRDPAGVRGLLCVSHNRAIGLLGDTVEGALAIAEYLRDPPAPRMLAEQERTGAVAPHAPIAPPLSSGKTGTTKYPDAY
jgi:hypothetical protein